MLVVRVQPEASTNFTRPPVMLVVVVSVSSPFISNVPELLMEPEVQSLPARAKVLLLLIVRAPSIFIGFVANVALVPFSVTLLKGLACPCPAGRNS